MQNSQDLLAEIFGSSAPASTSASPQPASSISPQPQKSNIQDILGLFDASPSPASPAPAPSLAFSIPVQPLAQTQAPPSPAQQQPSTVPRLTSYTAYEKNELKITLTPQTSAARPGIVNIMARFQVSGTNTATGLHFQAAVPKVCLANDGFGDVDWVSWGTVTTAADASHVEFGRAAWDDRNATAACDRSSRGKSLPVDKSPDGELILLLTKVESAATIARGVYDCWTSDTGSDRFLWIPSRADRVYVMSGVSCL